MNHGHFSSANLRISRSPESQRLWTDIQPHPLASTISANVACVSKNVKLMVMSLMVCTMPGERQQMSKTKRPSGVFHCLLTLLTSPTPHMFFESRRHSMHLQLLIIRSLGRYWSKWIKLEISRAFFPQKSAVSIIFLGGGPYFDTPENVKTSPITSWCLSQTADPKLDRLTQRPQRPRNEHSEVHHTWDLSLPGGCFMHQQIFEKPRHKAAWNHGGNGRRPFGKLYACCLACLHSYFCLHTYCNRIVLLRYYSKNITIWRRDTTWIN